MMKVLLIPFLVASLQFLMIVEAKWTKISHFPICFEGRNDKPGEFMYLGKEIIVGALRLEWKSGSIRCVSDSAYDSRWGCHHHSSFRKHPFNVIVTDKNNKIIFPLKKYIKNAALWYYLPAQDDKESKAIVFSNFAVPLYLNRMMALRIWYGEDLKNSAETDNQGRVCVDISAFVLNDPSMSGGGGGSGGSGGAANSRAVKLLGTLKTTLNEVLKSYR